MRRASITQRLGLPVGQGADLPLEDVGATATAVGSAGRRARRLGDVRALRDLDDQTVVHGVPLDQAKG